MASVYEYITLADLEDFTGIDYSTIDATAFHDDHVNMNITTAEELINGFLGVSVAQTVTNAITLATKFLSGWFLNKIINNLGYRTENTNPVFELTWDQIIKLVKDILNSDVGVDSIPMQGADRYYTPFRGFY